MKDFNIINLIFIITIVFGSCKKNAQNTPITNPAFIEDIIVSDENAKLGDVEMDIYGKRITWQSIDDNKLWICDIDPLTGKLAVGSGKQTLIGDAIVPLTTSFNSGEWAFSKGGTSIVYNKVINNAFYIAIANENSSGTWSTNILTDKPNRFNPRATKNPTDLVSSVQYVTFPGSGSTKYKYFNLPNNELSIDGFTDAHWAEDEQLLTGILPNKQVALFNPENPSKSPVQLTNNLEVNFSRPYMWRAPDHANARMFFAKANTNQIQVFKETTPNSNIYLLFTQFKCPSTLYPNIASPEPVVFNGKSYITFMASESTLETSGKPSEIWIAALDNSITVFKMVSNNRTSVRTDPEPYIDLINNQLFIYYTEVDDSVNPDFKIDPTTILKLRRCKTGF